MNLKTKGISKEDIERFDYLVKEGYLCGSTRYTKDISILEVRNDKYVSYAKVLFDNLAEVVDGDLGLNVWYMGTYPKEDSKSIGEFTEVNNEDVIISMVKNFILNYNPTLYSSTLLGYKYNNEYERIVNDPNRKTSYLIIGNEKYRVDKYKLEVSIKNNNKELAFNLDADEYYKAVKRQQIFNEIHKLSLTTSSFLLRTNEIRDKLNELNEFL